MRIAFFLLLLANLVFLLWHTQIRSDDDRQALPEIPADKRLVLLSEHRQKDSPQPASTARPEAPAEPVAPASETAALPDITITNEPETPEPEPAPPRMACYTLGPFKELNRAKSVSRRLEQLGATVERRSKVEQEQYGYRVYLKSYATREEAVAEARKLAEYGIRDYYIIADEDDRENGISLGLFRKKSGAIRRMAQVRRFDVQPHMEIRYRDTTIYWLDYEHRAGIDSRPLWRELTEETPDLQRLDRDCPSATG